MGSVIGILFLIARIIITIHVKAILFLLKHFDVTNGLIAGSTFQIVTGNLHINIWVRVGIVIGIIVGSILLQHFFMPARIIFGILSSAFLGIIAYGIFQENTKFSPYIPMGIAIAIAGSLNVISWYRISHKLETNDE